jgi:protein SCO1/2
MRLAFALLLACLAASAAAQEPPRRFLLQTTRGQAVSNEDFPGQWLLVAFGYTLCPDVCPTNLAVIAEVLDRLGDRAQRVTPVFVTVDPDRDTPEVLDAYAKAFHPRMVALTGPKTHIDHAVKTFNAFYAYHPTGAGDYVVDHTASTALVAPDGTLAGRFGHGTAPERMAEAVAEALDRAGSPRRP